MISYSIFSQKQTDSYISESCHADFPNSSRHPRHYIHITENMMFSGASPHPNFGGHQAVLSAPLINLNGLVMRLASGCADGQNAVGSAHEHIIVSWVVQQCSISQSLH